MKKPRVPLNPVIPALGEPLGVLLPQMANTSHLNEAFKQSISFQKSPRDYYLPGFCSLYELAYPAMLAGLDQIDSSDLLSIKIARYEALSKTKEARQIEESFSRNDFPSLFRKNLSAEEVALTNAFLQTEASDDYCVIMNDLLDLLESQKAVTKHDSEILKHKINEFSNLAVGEECVLNSIKEFSSKKRTSIEDNDVIDDSSIAGISSTLVQSLDRRVATADKIVPVAKSLLIKNKNKALSQTAIELGAFLPILASLNNDRVVGLIMEVASGCIAGLRLIRLPDGESEPPVYGPIRSMITQLLDAEAKNKIDTALQTKKEFQNYFLAVSVLGAVSTYKEPNAIFSTAKALPNGDVSLASELFISAPSEETVFNLNPVGVRYDNLDEKKWVIKQNRLCFYGHEFNKFSPHHQNAVVFGSNTNQNESACLDSTCEIAKSILSSSSSLFTGIFGADEVVESPEEILAFLAIKYDLIADSFSSFYDQLTGKYGYSNGVASEVYALFYQEDFLSSPMLFDLMLRSSDFLSKVTFGPQIE